jgi:hypothetical protein
MSAPKVPDTPAVPERQAAKLPDGGSTADRTDQSLARRRALMATVFTSPNGTMGVPTTTTGTAGKTTLG